MGHFLWDGPYIYSRPVNQTDVAWRVIPDAYERVSDNGRLPAHARQIYYAVRNEIQKKTGRPLDSVDFTQNLLPRFMNERPGLVADWWVVYDSRGHLIEPHTDKTVPLGTLEVDKYLREIKAHKVDGVDLEKVFDDTYPTCGPKKRYSAILFIEKEGFNPLFEEVKLAERYDIAIMSTKGQSVVAARHAVDLLCHGDVPVLILHDFDENGFSISERLTSVSCAAEEAGRVRYRFRHEINVIDLGLRLEDVKAWNLDSETVKFEGKLGEDTIATPEELEFLRNGQRVELNEFTSADFIAWIEGKLEEHGIKKLVPDRECLEAAYRRALQIAHANRGLKELMDEAASKSDNATPASLADDIEAALADNPARSWDQVLAEIAGKEIAEEENKQA